MKNLEVIQKVSTFALAFEKQTSQRWGAGDWNAERHWIVRRWNVKQML